MKGVVIPEKDMQALLKAVFDVVTAPERGALGDELELSLWPVLWSVRGVSQQAPGTWVEGGAEG